MNEILNKEARLIQNPALGAVLQWRFIATYNSENPRGEGCPFLLTFIVLPVLFYSDTSNILQATKKESGLHMFAGKFFGSKIAKSDVLLNIHDRIEKMKDISLESLRVASTSRLIFIDKEKGVLHPVTKTPPNTNVPESVKVLISGADKLGSWCTRITPYEVSSILKVRF